jgi:hypothetical protein
MIVEILKKIAVSLVTALLTEEMVKKIIVALLEFISKKTTNEVDDKIVAIVKEALYPAKKEEPKAE